MSIKSKRVPKGKAMTHKEMRMAIIAEVMKVSEKGAGTMLVPDKKPFRLMFVDSTPFSLWWNRYAIADNGFVRPSFVAYVRAMCHVYQVQKLDGVKTASIPELPFTETQNAA